MLHTTDAAYAFNQSSTSSSSSAKDEDTQQNRANQQQQSMPLDALSTTSSGIITVYSSMCIYFTKYHDVSRHLSL
jgi:hypothetical protein